MILDEMPERCEDCPLKADDGYPNCVKHVDEYPITETPTKGRQAWCPLRPMPKRKWNSQNTTYCFGWNDAIEVIGGSDD